MPRKKVAPKAKEPVRLREKKLANGNVSLYLDYYNPDTGKHEYEFLKLYLIPEKTSFDKLANKQALNAANAIKSKRTDALIKEKAGLKPDEPSEVSELLLIDWMKICAENAEAMANTINRSTWGNTIRLTAEIVRKYAGTRTKLTDVDVNFVLGFVKYLRHKYTIERKGKRQPLAQGTQHKRFQCLQYVMARAKKKKLIRVNPFDELEENERITAPDSTVAFLTIEELKRLEDTPTRSEGTRCVYLFMCYCGLRISDVKKLTWADVNVSGEVWQIAIRQQKTQKVLYLPLSDKARELLPARNGAAASEPVFAGLPTEPAMNRALKMWAQKAGIEKN